jgi:hypothetical protein
MIARQVPRTTSQSYAGVAGSSMAMHREATRIQRRRSWTYDWGLPDRQRGSISGRNSPTPARRRSATEAPFLLLRSFAGGFAGRSRALRFLIATSARWEAANEDRSDRRQRADGTGSTSGPGITGLLAAAGDFHRMRAEDKAFWKVTKDDPGNKHADAFNQPDGLWTRIGGAVQRVSNRGQPRPPFRGQSRL